MISSPIKPFFGGSPELGFFLVKHCAISKQGVDFEEQCVEKLWVVWSHGPWKNRCIGAYIT
jgi:hypothetical protein